MSIASVATVATILLSYLVPSGAHASKVTEGTLQWVTPARIRERMTQPEVKQKVCDLLLERTDLHQHLDELQAERDLHQRRFDQTRSHLGAFGRWADQIYFLSQDFTEKDPPSKALKKINPKLHRQQLEVNKFNAEFDQRLISALSGAGHLFRFQRLLDERNRYERFYSEVGITRRTIERLKERFVEAEKLALKSDPKSRILTRIAYNRADRYLERHKQQVIDTFAFAQSQHVGIDCKTGDPINYSSDLDRYEATAKLIEKKIEQLYQRNQERIDLIKKIALEIAGY